MIWFGYVSLFIIRSTKLHIKKTLLMAPLFSVLLFLFAAWFVGKLVVCANHVSKQFKLAMIHVFTIIIIMIIMIIIDTSTIAVDLLYEHFRSVHQSFEHDSRPEGNGHRAGPSSAHVSDSVTFQDKTKYKSVLTHPSLLLYGSSRSHFCRTRAGMSSPMTCHAYPIWRTTIFKANNC